MENRTLNIIIKGIAMILLVAIILPSAVKLTHAFKNHKHEVCTNTLDTHFHEVEIDCEFYKFKLNNNFTVAFNEIIIFNNNNNYSTFYSKYRFLKSYKNFGIALRGPPTT